MNVLPWLASLLVLGGALISLLGAVGVLRLPDSYSRMHAASKAGVLGTVLILAGTAVASRGQMAGEALLGLLVLLASAPWPPMPSPAPRTAPELGRRQARLATPWSGSDRND